MPMTSPIDPTSPTTAVAAPADGPRAAQPWWRGCVIYQIYPRSFADSNGDGIGDLPGITSRLDHIANLGVDAIWIAPFYKSPMRDFGYDVADFRAVDPIFGTLDDFDGLVQRAHRLGLKVMIDQVLSHTSDEHPWFQESRSSRGNSKSDWYVWADPQDDGTPPNNWLSVFGGSAWQWDTRRQQYYLHNFLSSQPDLNLHHPQVQEQLLEEVRFWLARGVDGFRFDAVNFYFHDPLLRSNPARGAAAQGDLSTPDSNPYARQQHLYDKSRPENLDFLRQLRGLMDGYGDITSVGEIGDDDAVGLMAAYTGGGDKLHMAYTSGLMAARIDDAGVRDVVQGLEARIGSGWPCWAIGNHDAVRVISRVGGDAPRARLQLLLTTLMLSLRGSACIYQGEELALTEAEVPFDRLQDPYGLAFWPEYKGRDGCRTPMPWQHDAPHSGFSTAEPWLPLSPDHQSLAVDLQLADPQSTLRGVQRFVQWRRGQGLLRHGDILFLPAPEGCVAFTRSDGGESLRVIFNLSDQPVAWTCPPDALLQPLTGHGLWGSLEGHRVVLPPYSAFFGRQLQR